MHSRNKHVGRYDFEALTKSVPDLAAFVTLNPLKERTIDFANPAAVKALNRGLLKTFYGVSHWDIPPGYLCPPVPGRADYIHYAADLLSSLNEGTIPRGDCVRVNGARATDTRLSHNDQLQVRRHRFRFSQGKAP